jgi:hypothetical protein
MPEITEHCSKKQCSVNVGYVVRVLIGGSLSRSRLLFRGRVLYCYTFRELNKC